MAVNSVAYCQALQRMGMQRMAPGQGLCMRECGLLVWLRVCARGLLYGIMHICY